MPNRRRSVVTLLTLLAAISAPVSGATDAGQPTPEDRELAERLVEQARQRLDEDDPLGALRAYQRAWFWLAGPLGSPYKRSPPEWLGEIPPLAIGLDRIDEALRYATLLPPAVIEDPETVRKLALLAREGRDWRAAAALQQRWLTGPGGPREKLGRVLGGLEVGRLWYLAGEADAASQAFDEVEQALLDPAAAPRTRRQVAAALGGSLTTTWEVFGQAHFEAGRLDRAAAAFDQIPVAQQGTPSLRYWRARIALAKRRPLVAHELLAAGPATPYSDGHDTAWRGLLDQVYAQLNQPALMVDDLRRVAETDPDNPTLQALLGLALADSGPQPGTQPRTVGGSQTQEAADLLGRALQQAARAEQRDPLLANARGDDSFDEIDYQAIREAGEWLLADSAASNRVARFLNTANDLEKIFGTLEDFDQTLAKAFAEHPKFSNGIFRKLSRSTGGRKTPPMVHAELAAAAGRHGAAAAVYRRAFDSGEADARQEVALEWWRRMMLDDQHAAAAEAMRHAIENGAWPEEAYEPYYHLAAALALAEQHDEAVEAAQQAADRAPAEIDVRERVGWALIQAGRETEAIERHAKLIEYFEEETGPRERDTLRSVRLSLSYLTDNLGEVERASEWALQVLDEFPDDAGALNDLAYQWTKQGKHLQRALRMTRRAVALEPDSYAYLDSLAWAEHRLGKHAEALASVRRAIAMQEASDAPPDGEILDHLGDILTALDRPVEAGDAWRRAADAFTADGEQERAAQIRAKLSEKPEEPTAPPSSGEGGGL